MGFMFPWATTEFLLYHMSLDQIIYYYNHGWEAKQTEAKIYWGTYGSLLNGDTSKKPNATPVKEIVIGETYDSNGKLVRG